MTVITVTIGAFRLTYASPIVTVLRPPICGERHLIVITVTLRSRFGMGF